MALASLIGSYVGDQPAWASDIATDLRTLRDRVNVVTAEQIDTNAVLESKIASGAVTTGKIADVNVTTAKIADDAITTAKIVDAAVTFAKLSLTSSGIPLMKIGTYTGNGTSSNPVTGVGFQPDFLFLVTTSSTPVLMFGIRAYGTSLAQIDNGAWVASAISYQSDGFTLTSSYLWSNTNAWNFYYIAFKVQ